MVEVFTVEIAKITSKGQITIPIEIRKKLKLSEGDKVIFVEEGDRYFLANSSIISFCEMQKVMEGAAEAAGINDEEDVNQLIKNMRKEKQEKKYANNDRH